MDELEVVKEVQVSWGGGSLHPLHLPTLLGSHIYKPDQAPHVADIPRRNTSQTTSHSTQTISALPQPL